MSEALLVDAKAHEARHTLKRQAKMAGEMYDGSSTTLRSLVLVTKTFLLWVRSELLLCLCQEKQQQKHETQNVAGFHKHFLVNYPLGHGEIA